MLAHKTHVALVFDNLDLSGAEKVAVNLLRHSHRMRQVVMHGFVCMDDRIGCAQVSENLDHLSPDLRNEGGLLFRLWKAFVAVKRLRSKARRFELLIAVTPPAAIFARLATLFLPCRVIPWVHYDLNGIQREQFVRTRLLRDFLQKVLYTRFIPSFRELIFVSNATRRSFARDGHVGLQNEWVVLPNILDQPSFLPKKNSASFGRALELKRVEEPLLLFLGRIFRQKRWEDAITVSERLVEAGWNFNLVFVGDGIERNTLLERMKASSAASRLHYLGPDSNPIPTLKLASGIVLTSRYEAWPTVILEANLAKVPVFSYDCPSGPRQMLGDNLRGVLSEESPEALAGAIIDYFSWDEGRKAQMLEDAYEFARQFEPELVIPLWERQLLLFAAKRVAE